jgi:nucleotide-binding universal stress UspA family protein
MKKKILIALDYSPLAGHVAAWGQELSNALQAETTLLHVVVESANYSASIYDPIMGFVGFPYLDHEPERPPDTSTQEALAYLEKTRQHLKNHTMKTLVAKGNVSELILDTAQEMQADIIVIGTSSRRGLEEFLLGSTAHKLIQTAHTPLFIIPNHHE